MGGIVGRIVGPPSLSPNTSTYFHQPLTKELIPKRREKTRDKEIVPMPIGTIKEIRDEIH